MTDKRWSKTYKMDGGNGDDNREVVMLAERVAELESILKSRNTSIIIRDYLLLGLLATMMVLRC